jgi:hypothetical protein
VGGQDNEALYRDLFVSTHEAEQNRKATIVAKKRDRSFDRSWSQAQRVIAHMCKVEVVSPRGKFPAFAFNFDSPLMHRFILRMCRALLHAETGTGYLESRIENWKVNPEADLREPLLKAAKGRVVSEEFAYAGVFMVGRPTSVWLLNFYQSLEFYAIMQTDWKMDAAQRGS